MKSLPKITIVTPSLNQREFIKQTIDSVLSQGYPDLEYFVIDGGSTDGTVEILKHFTGRLEWVSEPDRGQSHAINKGLKKSTGEVIGFLNSDDTYEPGALMEIGECFSRDPRVLWATGECRNIDAQGGEIRRAVAIYKKAWLRVKSYTVLQVLNFISQPATFWRRKAMAEVGFLDETLRYAMDYDYWLRLGRVYPLRVIHKTIASYRIHSLSKAGSNISAQFDSEMAIARKHVRSRTLLALHSLHRLLVIGMYRLVYF